ncbi:hypothetical protein GYMLUDRAFT_244129 [Collybiopsis luxurians FD-317 M1]|uniref:Uncharacterized protein n=1 Tax=Collybiopsis luxurians FD-317 M1 TaxID=944289 RepID=A0A0D0CWQ5_9AGAR|nr:hypothetical protein GYMLUDRAFT_244129 [Collybiopsis luxurians FD-317 M1]
MSSYPNIPGKGKQCEIVTEATGGGGPPEEPPSSPPPTPSNDGSDSGAEDSKDNSDKSQKSVEFMLAGHNADDSQQSQYYSAGESLPSYPHSGGFSDHQQEAKENELSSGYWLQAGQDGQDGQDGRDWDGNNSCTWNRNNDNNAIVPAIPTVPAVPVKPNNPSNRQFGQWIGPSAATGHSAYEENTIKTLEAATTSEYSEAQEDIKPPNEYERVSTEEWNCHMHEVSARGAFLEDETSHDELYVQIEGFDEPIHIDDPILENMGLDENEQGNA